MVKSIYRTILILCLLSLLSSDSVAQNVEIPKKEAIKISGNININLGLYEAFGIEARRDRFSYLFAANLNPRLLGVDMPLNAIYSQQETTFLQPFNQLGFSPQYKWITAHIGFRNLNYSPLTLNGHTFLGAGIELKPKMIKGPVHFRLSAMYGRFRRAIEPVDVQEIGILPAYRRMGYALKFGFVSKKKATDYLDFIVFRGYDIENSIEEPVNNQEIKPEDNLVLGITGQYKLLKKLSLKLDVASSALTRDTRTEAAETGEGIFKYTGSLFSPKVSSQFKNAIKSSLNYNERKFQIGLRYNRIAPEYRTLGSYFFQNDMEDLTLNAGTSFSKGKIQINGSIGFQRNNLEEQKNTSQNRLIGSLNYSHTLGPQFSYNLSYSNFSSSLLIVKEELSDSLNLYQISTNYNAGANYSFGTTKNPQGLSLNLSHQIGNSRDEYSINEAITRFYNAGVSYKLGFKPQEMSLQFAFNYTKNDADLIQFANVGPSVSLNKKLADGKLNVRYLLSYLNNISEGQSDFGILNNRAFLTYKVKKKHRIKFAIGILQKIDEDDTKSYSELRSTMGYQFRF